MYSESPPHAHRRSQEQLGSQSLRLFHVASRGWRALPTDDLGFGGIKDRRRPIGRTIAEGGLTRRCSKRGQAAPLRLVQGAHPCADELTSRYGFFEETRVHI